VFGVALKAVSEEEENILNWKFSTCKSRKFANQQIRQILTAYVA
jgi:hypothetical protein